MFRPVANMAVSMAFSRLSGDTIGFYCVMGVDKVLRSISSMYGWLRCSDWLFGCDGSLLRYMAAW